MKSRSVSPAGTPNSSAVENYSTLHSDDAAIRARGEELAAEHQSGYSSIPPVAAPAPRVPLNTIIGQRGIAFNHPFLTGDPVSSVIEDNILVDDLEREVQEMEQDYVDFDGGESYSQTQEHYTSPHPLRQEEEESTQDIARDRHALLTNGHAIQQFPSGSVHSRRNSERMSTSPLPPNEEQNEEQDLGHLPRTISQGVENDISGQAQNPVDSQNISNEAVFPHSSQDELPATASDERGSQSRLSHSQVSLLSLLTVCHD